MLRIKRVFAFNLALLLLILALTGCGNNNVADTANGTNVAHDINEADDSSGSNADFAQTVNARQLASLVREGDFEEGNFIFDPPIHGVAQTQSLEWEIDFDPADRGIDDLSRIMTVYLDSSFSVSANPIVEYDADRGILIVSPNPSRPIPWQISHNPYEGNYWGYHSQFFLVRYFGREGEVLEQPIVTIFMIENELEAPFVNFSVDNGFASFSWNPVPGALSYRFYIVRTFYREGSGYYFSGQPFWETEETSFTYESVDVFRGRHTAYNLLLTIFENQADYFIAALALNGDMHSGFSNSIHSRDIAPLLPFRVALDGANYVVDINDLSVFRNIEMADGSFVKMPVYYHIDEAEVNDMSLVAPGEFEPAEMFGVRIPFNVHEINMRGYAFVREFDYPEFEQDLHRLKEREETEQRAARIAPRIKRATGDEVIPDEETVLLVDGFRVNASNPFSEFLAIHMLNGAEHVDFREFPEAFDSEFLIAAWHEAIYQNPLVLKVKGISWTIFGDLFIEYGQTREEQEYRQAVIMREVRRIVDEIITDDMTDFEKQLAINNYLIDNAEYDFAALEYAEQYDFMHVDSRFYDSFTAYGILINGIGVCSGYAAAFRLLADEVGLPNIVVTGHMFGTLPHAWNRVLIDGEWLTLDVTNNDSEYMRNIYFNLPDHVSKIVLVEDNRFSMSGTDYSSRTYQWEYFQTVGLFYSLDTIAAALVRDLNDRGYATLRTYYDLSQDEFFSIVMEVALTGGFDIHNMIGTTMLGAIYLAIEN